MSNMFRIQFVLHGEADWTRILLYMIGSFNRSTKAVNIGKCMFECKSKPWLKLVDILHSPRAVDQSTKGVFTSVAHF